jgi:ABC-type multidrug transport system fused ATPase/permease subunit
MKKNKFIKEETKFSGQYNKRIFKTLKYSYAPFLKSIYFLLALGLIGRALLLFNTNLLGYWVDSYCTNCEKPTSGIRYYLLDWSKSDYLMAILLLCLLGFSFTILFRIYFSRFSAKAVSRLYDEVSYRTSRYPMSFFDTTPTGRIITRFSSDYGNVFRIFGGPLAEFLAIISDLIVMIVLITLASPIYLIFVGLITFLNYVVYRYNRHALRKERRELSHSRAPTIAHFAETAFGAASIRSYLRQNTFFSRFKSLNNYFLNQKIKTFKQLTLFSFQMNSLSALLLLLVGITSYLLLDYKIVTVGAVGVAFTFITLSGSTVQMFFEWLAQFEEAMIGIERLDQYLHLPIEKGLTLPSHSEFVSEHWREKPGVPTDSNLFLKELGSSAEVSVSKLSFRYRQDLPWVLNDINFTIAAGERLGIVGKTGSGKSSLIQTLFYLYPLDYGTITINHRAPMLTEKDKTDPEKIPLSLYRKLIALIGQDPTLFRGTLTENLTSGDPLISPEEIQTALERVGLLDWVLSLPKKFDYFIDEKGKNLSHGEKQLLCMARCLLQKSPVVIMDEATSSVDPQSEEIMIKATENFFANRTQIIIAHRLSTLEKCDKILWLNRGRIEIMGPKDLVLPKFTSVLQHEIIM